MKYTLITKTGTCISFYSESVARTYLSAFGGFLTCHDIDIKIEETV